MKPTILSIAIGSSYEAEVLRLQYSVPDLLVVDKFNPLYSEGHTDAMTNGLLTKAGFAKFLPDDGEGAVILCDTDLYAVGEGNPFDDFPVLTADVALVPYDGRFFFPPNQSLLAASYAKLGKQLNSGLVWFRTHEIARAVSLAWEAQYLLDIADYSEGIRLNDEFALMVALADSSWTLAWLDKKWNNIWTDDADDKLRHGRLSEIEWSKLHPQPPAPTPIHVPSPITAWQAKAALAMTPHSEAGTMLVAAEAALAAIPDGAEKIVVLSAWNNNAKFERTSPTILSFGAVLGMTSDDLDNLFRLGGELTV